MSKLTKSDLKKMLKPIVKECIQESLIEGGILSGIISEVVRGVAPTQVIVEDNKEQEKELYEAAQIQQEEDYRTNKLNETRKKMLDAIGKDSYNGVNLFEGTEPIKSAPSPGESITPSSPLSGRGSKDAGVNIDGLMSTVGRNWGKLAKGK
jgi:hypothetical protein